MADHHFDLCVIGGGINGAGIARDAAGRGLRTILLEQGDLAQATSSASTKLVHGGLRYLEYYEFRLVRESLREREALLRIAPQIVWPMTFVLPHRDAVRPYWMIRAGLMLYDALAGRKSLPSSQAVSLSDGAYGRPLSGGVERGFTYADCWVDDARLVVLNARSAALRGADIRTRTSCTALRPVEGQWAVDLHDHLNGETTTIVARAVVNAAGPWVRSLLDELDLSDTETPMVRLVQGSHLIVPKLYSGDHAYLMQQPDGRVVFTIPYEGKYTLVGTTETAYRGDPLKAEITAQEIDYLLSAVNAAFLKQTALPDIVRTYSGVRPLFDDASKDAKAVTRDYRLHESWHEDSWLLSVFGGKLTTYRKLAEQVADRVTETLTHTAAPWTDTEALPGGQLGMTLPDFITAKTAQWSQVDPSLIERYARSYGTDLDLILNADAGEDYGQGVCEAELRHMIVHEFARTAEDVLWRRSKLGLHLNADVQNRIRAALPRLVKELTGYETSRD